ncbi:glycoside hydrolase family 125 protein [Gaoshiqia sediminis]|uniref:Glycoside hydrolase family 125 protein n=1 Tax=Gaoshiqia sediminis TaxID=2986998 RepID=A0AA41Y5C9_9BACT|nr:glycoside hydrolase family 125 protein [Gaoshiqia sediminis]MCW0481417.1 glycoside hydrolase family 125 protein [Gaoshiqia sediminis]
MERRNFIKYNALAAAGMLSAPVWSSAFATAAFESKRPPVGKRNFISKAVEDTILEVKKTIANPELAWMFENCFPNTLDTTVDFSTENGKPDTFVITGDIHAMWLRDSTAQVWPYLSLVKEDERLNQLFLGVLNRQAKCILIDPYANAFNKEAAGSEWETDDTDMKPELHERKWEIDSLCYPIRLLYHYWKSTGNEDCFSEDWHIVFRSILSTFIKQQRKEKKGDYHFTRVTHKPTDTLCCGGYGNPVNPVGLIVSSFRPSDDATIFPFLIPSNYFAVTSLTQMAEIASVIYGDEELAAGAQKLAGEVTEAIEKFALAERPDFGKVIAFEVDGFGNRLFMDDANIPSLLALPYLGALDVSDPVYQNTRRLVLSDANPWFFRGKAGEGIGGPHVGADMIWPMSIVMQAMTSTSDDEIVRCVRILLKTHAGTGFMHETFHKDNPENFTRSWFAWANTLFGELILKLYHTKPDLLKEI